MPKNVFNGPWYVLNRITKEYRESHPTKAEAMKVVTELNEADSIRGVEHQWAVVPGSFEKKPTPN